MCLLRCSLRITFTKSARNGVVQRFSESPVGHLPVRSWLSPQRDGEVSGSDHIEATALLARMAQHPSYHYLPISVDWNTLCSRFFRRLYGTKQVTDAYLLGLAVREGLALVTLDKAVVHLAGDEHRESSVVGGEIAAFVVHVLPYGLRRFTRPLSRPDVAVHYCGEDLSCRAQGRQSLGEGCHHRCNATDRSVLRARWVSKSWRPNDPRLSPQNRPYVISSKPANGIGRRRDCFTLL